MEGLEAYKILPVESRKLSRTVFDLSGKTFDLKLRLRGHDIVGARSASIAGFSVLLVFLAELGHINIVAGIGREHLLIFGIFSAEVWSDSEVFWACIKYEFDGLTLGDANVHRDVVANILDVDKVDPEAGVQLFDFGLN